jgi:hypothetical protein
MRTTAIMLALLAGACAGKAPSPTSPGGGAAPPLGAGVSGKLSEDRVGSKLVQDAIDSPKVFTLVPNAGDGRGIGQFSGKLDGRPLWPPIGPRCEALSRCCEALAGVEDALGLACLLAVGRDPDCGTALQTVEAIAAEHGLSLPPACPR